MLLKDKVAIITGCSSGVGYSAALQFAREGAKTYAVARRENLLEDLKNEAKDKGYAGEIIPIKADVSSKEDIKTYLTWSKKTMTG